MGAVVCVGFLAGLVPGPLVAPVVGFALMTFGRSLPATPARNALGALAWGVLALGVGVGALRWGTSSLDAIRGVQAVLGPTILVEPQEAAVGAGLAAGGGTVALGLWLATLRPRGLWPLLWSFFEAVVGALLLASAFWGPAVVARGAGDASDLARDLGGWALVVLASAMPAFGLSFLFRKLAPVWSWVAFAVSLTAVVAGTTLVSSVVIR
jgi:hypothetical protein